MFTHTRITNVDMPVSNCIENDLDNENYRRFAGRSPSHGAKPVHFDDALPFLMLIKDKARMRLRP